MEEMGDGVKKFLLVLFIGAVLSVIAALVILPPYFEVREFNRCTGGHATYMTALFTDLRVTDCKN